MPKRKIILFITPYPEGEAPSQRFRFEQYLDVLQSKEFDYQTQSFLTSSNWRVFYGPGQIVKKVSALVLGFWRRTVGLLAVRHADFVFIHREATPLGPPIFEWIIAKVLRKRIIYDFDDALWLTDRKDESQLTTLIKWRGKVSSICKWSYRVSCGNDYLCTFAKKFNDSVVLNPTTIDTVGKHRTGEHTARVKSGNSAAVENVVIGWTGSHSTLKYFEQLEPVLKVIEENYSQVNFLVIANKAPTINLNRLTFALWNELTEIEDLAKIDIGLMPLPDDEWARGKCGFKILQYMALEIPSVSSPVGANTVIVDDGVNGFLADSGNEWIEKLSRLIADADLRAEIGCKGKETVAAGYSVISNTPVFLALFE